MRKRVRSTSRSAVIGGAAAALAAATLTTAGSAAADSDFIPTVRNLTLSPGYSWGVADSAYGTADGTVVYAFSKKPLTDASWSGGGSPSGLTITPDVYGCKVYAGVAGIFTCPVTEDNTFDQPEVSADKTAANDTTAYAGVAYVPRGGNIAAGVKAAQLAGTTSDPDTPSAAVIKVRTPAEVAKSTVQLTTPNVALSSSLVQTVHVRAADSGQLAVTFSRTWDERDWDMDEVDIQVTAVDGGPDSSCDHTTGSIGYGESVDCVLQPGDHTVTYTLTSGANVAAWKIATEAEFRVVDYGVGNPVSDTVFSVTSPYPVRERYRILGRDAQGFLYYYDGTGKAAAPYQERFLLDGGYGGYNAITALSPLTVHGTGDLAARDGSGVLWYYRGTGDGSILAARAKIGSGWGVYSTVTGADDLTGDAKPDLIARDTGGVLWLYKGTGSPTAPFAPRIKVGAGWNTYNSLTTTGDLTGDGRPDLLGRDGSGVLWLYRGTGNAAAPYSPRVQIGTGWNTYTALFSSGDLTSDGRTDFLGRDGSGVLWLYKGTGNAAAPYAARTKVGTGWNIYDILF